jgi:hypothetical protein
MPLTDTSKIALALKKLQGKAQTDNLKEIYNESKYSAPNVYAGTIPSLEIPPTPANSSLYSLTTSNGINAVEYLRLPLVADPSSNGHAFYATLPADYESNSLQQKRGRTPWQNGTPLYSTAGKIQIVPPLYGLRYEAVPYIGGTTAKGTGTVIPSGDDRDWVLDYFNGVFFQQDLTGAAPNYLECLVYVGDMVSDGAGATTALKTNQDSTPMVFGQVVYFTTTDGALLARADVADLNKYDLGIAADTIAPGAVGPFFYKPGTVIGGYTGLTSGQFYWIDPITAGAMTNNSVSFTNGHFLYQVGSALNATQFKLEQNFILQL